jgi:hypothetical protein
MADQKQQPTTTPLQDGDAVQDPIESEPSTFTHVADACDMQWHNPACGGASGTWLRSCSLLNGKCTCLHS